MSSPFAPRVAQQQQRIAPAPPATQISLSHTVTTQEASVTISQQGIRVNIVVQTMTVAVEVISNNSSSQMNASSLGSLAQASQPASSRILPTSTLSPAQTAQAVQVFRSAFAHPRMSSRVSFGEHVPIGNRSSVHRFHQ